MNLSLLLNTAHHERCEPESTTHENNKGMPSYDIMKISSSTVENVFSMDCLFLSFWVINSEILEVPNSRSTPHGYVNSNTLKKVREIEHTLAWFWSSLAIRGSGGGLVWPQIHEIRLCLPNGWYGDTRDFAGLDFQVCLLDSSVASVLIQRASRYRWPINQLSSGKKQPEFVGFEGTCGLHWAPKYGDMWLQYKWAESSSKWLCFSMSRRDIFIKLKHVTLKSC